MIKCISSSAFRASLLLLSLLVVYCDDSPDSTEPVDPFDLAVLCLSDSSCDMQAPCDTSHSITVSNCGNDAVFIWTVSSDSAWLSFPNAGGITLGQFTIIADSNRSGSDRAALVNVKAPALKDSLATIAITQPTLEPMLCVSLSQWEAPSLGDESMPVLVDNCGDLSSIDWVASELEDWLELSQVNGTTPSSFTLMADTNNTNLSRSATVTVTAEGITGSPWEIIVQQEPVIGFAASYETDDGAFDVSVSGDFAYVADRYGGLDIVNVSDPTSPTLAATYPVPNYARGVFALGNYAYVAGAWSGLLILDVSEPTSPTFVGGFDTPDFAIDVYVSGDYAYVIDGTTGLFIFDISDPSNPDSLGNWPTTGWTHDIFVLGDYAYVADGGSLEIIDISDKTNPVTAGSFPSIDCVWGVVVRGDYAYIASAICGFQIVDVSNVSTPTLVGSCETVDFGWGIFVEGDYAYVADNDGGLQIIDISDPSNPILIAGYDAPRYSYSVSVSNGYAYLTDLAYGLFILKLGL